MKAEYIVVPHTGIGAIKFSPTLAQGWNLTALDAEADSKTPEMITAIGSLTGSILTSTSKAAGRLQPLGPGLYTFQFDKSTGMVSGLVEIFQVLDTKEKPAKCSNFTAPQG
jgi:hypothetical protein